MANKDWKFDIREGFESHEVVVQIHESSGRAAIRFDGKIIGPPLERGFGQREFPVGSSRYRVTRTDDDEFFLDLVVEKTPQQKKAWRDPSTASTRIGGVIFKVVLAAILLTFVGAGVQMYHAYFVSWYNYNAKENAFQIKLPAKPEESVRAELNVAEVSQDDCFYLVASKRLYPPFDNQELLDGIVAQWKRSGAEVVEETTFHHPDVLAGRAVKMNYTGEIEGEKVDSSMKIVVAISHYHLILLIAEYPRHGWIPAMKIDRFLRSFKPGV